MRERTTREVARDAGISVDLLRKWKKRGLLKHAPPGVAGQGRGVECMWSEEAFQEVKAWAEKDRPHGVNHRYAVT